MPATSVAQRRLFGLALHHPEKVMAENRGVLKASKSSMREFASTPEKNLPAAHRTFRSHVTGKESELKKRMRRAMRKAKGED